MLCIFLLRDVFERLKCCLDLWLSSLLNCIHFSVFFLSLKNCFYQAQQLLDRYSTDSYLSSLLNFFSRQILSLFQSIELSGICLNSFSTDSQSIEKVYVWLIAVQSIEVFLPSTNSRQHLDRFYLSRISVSA